MATKKLRSASLPVGAFDLHAFLDSAGIARRVAKYAKGGTIFSQGDSAADVFYLQKGSIKVSVLSRTGKEAVVAILGAGDFFGEGCLAGQPRRMASAVALSTSTVLVVEKHQMLKSCPPRLGASFSGQSFDHEVKGPVFLRRGVSKRERGMGQQLAAGLP